MLQSGGLGRCRDTQAGSSQTFLGTETAECDRGVCTASLTAVSAKQIHFPWRNKYNAFPTAFLSRLGEL